MIRPARILAITALLAACGEQREPAPEPQRIALEETGQRPAVAFASPDTSNGIWTVADNGQAIHFGNAGEAPWLTLGCDLATDPALFTVIRHAQAYPGQSALFPVIGNGVRSRFLADATLAADQNGGEWRWEARLPATDPQLDVFAGTRDLTATLPGRGMLEIAGSRIPGEFLEWCRTGGEVPEVVPNQVAPNENSPNEDSGILAEEDA